MALSECERRALGQIERVLAKDSPRLARQLLQFDRPGSGHCLRRVVIRTVCLMAGIGAWVAGTHVDNGFGTALAIVSYLLAGATIATALPRI